MQICASFVSQPSVAKSSIREKDRDIAANCARAEAYRLHRAPGSNETIAATVTQACASELGSYVKHFERDGQVSATDLQGEFFRFAQYQVTRARAGNCDPPPKDWDK